MNIERIVFLLEELSAKKMIEIIIPKLTKIKFDAYHFQGKQDLEKNITKKIQNWQAPNTVFVIIRDQDSENCKNVKNRLTQLCKKAGKENCYLVRIACHELESFFLGDLDAVKSAGYKIKLSKKFSKGYSNPDSLSNASDELTKITYNEYQKVQGSTKIAPFLKLDGSNKSDSFNMLLKGIKKIITVQ